MVAVRDRLLGLEGELRALTNADLTDERRDEVREQIRAKHLVLSGQQGVIGEWISRLWRAIDNLERRLQGPQGALRQAISELALINERLDTLTEQAQALQGEREVAALRLSTAQAAVDAVAIDMPERPQYPTPR